MQARTPRGRKLPMQVPFEDAMHHQVGVAANGRRKMAVIGQGQAIMAERALVIPGALHGPQQQAGDDAFLRPAGRARPIPAIRHRYGKRFWNPWRDAWHPPMLPERTD